MTAQPPIPESYHEREWASDEIRTVDHHGHHRYWQIFVYLAPPNTGFDQRVVIKPAYYESNEPIPGLVAYIDTRQGIISTADGANARTRNQTEPTVIAQGKNLGKKNATNVLTQAVSDARSRYRKHLKSSASKLTDESRTATAAAISPAAARLPPASAPTTNTVAPTTDTVAPTADNTVAPAPRPVMLARNLEDKWPPLEEFCREGGIYVLRKFDGTRAGVMLQRKVSGENATKIEPVFFGRRLDLQERRAHLYLFLQPLFATAERLGWNAEFGPMILDGEIYRHGWSRQEIIGKEHRQSETAAAEAGLDYYVFLIRFPFTEAGRALPISRLLEMRRRLFAETPVKLDAEKRQRIYGAEFFPVVLPALCDKNGKPLAKTKAEVAAAQQTALVSLNELMNRFLDEKYEGAVIYRGTQPYEESTESHRKGTLLRHKPVYEEEFEVADFEAAKRGRDEGAIIWWALTPSLRVLKNKPATERKRFKVTFKNMSVEDRKRWFREMSEKDNKGQTAFERLYKGKPLSVEFRDYTDDGVPMHAWATGFRDAAEIVKNDKR